MVIKDGYLEEVGLTSIWLGGWASTDSVRAKVNSERLILFSKGGVCMCVCVNSIGEVELWSKVSLEG